VPHLGSLSHLPWQVLHYGSPDGPAPPILEATASFFSGWIGITAAASTFIRIEKAPKEINTENKPTNKD